MAVAAASDRRVVEVQSADEGQEAEVCLEAEEEVVGWWAALICAALVLVLWSSLIYQRLADLDPLTGLLRRAKLKPDQIRCIGVTGDDACPVDRIRRASSGILCQQSPGFGPESPCGPSH